MLHRLVIYQERLFNENGFRISDRDLKERSRRSRILRGSMNIFKVMCKFALMPDKIKLIPIGPSPENYTALPQDLYFIVLSQDYSMANRRLEY